MEIYRLIFPVMGNGEKIEEEWYDVEVDTATVDRRIFTKVSSRVLLRFKPYWGNRAEATECDLRFGDSYYRTQAAVLDMDYNLCTIVVGYQVQEYLVIEKRSLLHFCEDNPMFANSNFSKIYDTGLGRVYSDYMEIVNAESVFGSESSNGASFSLELVNEEGEPVYLSYESQIEGDSYDVSEFTNITTDILLRIGRKKFKGLSMAKHKALIAMIFKVLPGQIIDVGVDSEISVVDTRNQVANWRRIANQERVMYISVGNQLITSASKIDNSIRLILNKDTFYYATILKKDITYLSYGNGETGKRTPVSEVLDFIEEEKRTDSIRKNKCLLEQHHINEFAFSLNKGNFEEAEELAPTVNEVFNNELKAYLTQQYYYGRN